VRGTPLAFTTCKQRFFELEAAPMWYMKGLVDRAQVAFLLWQLRRRKKY
jgi:hypothetical protein